MIRKHQNERDKLIIRNEQTIKKLLNDGTFEVNSTHMKLEDIRIVIFADKASRLRFDSETIKVTTDSAGKSKLIFGKPLDDTKSIGDIVFGESQTIFEAGTFKVHHDVSKRLMVSRLFAIPRNRILAANHVLYNDTHSVNEIWDAHAADNSNAYRNSMRTSFNTVPPEYLRSIGESSPDVSRITRSTRGSYVSFGSSRRLISTLKLISTSNRYIGYAVLFNPKYSKFLFSNWSFLHRELNNLQMELYNAFTDDKDKFYFSTAKSCKSFSNQLMMFHNAMRLTRSAISISADERFVRDFVHLIDIYETKKNGYFLSKLISAVMMYHLTWTLTADLPLSVDNRPGFTSKPLLTALGCVGQLSHTTRIVVRGADASRLSQVLNVLIFFTHIERKRSIKKDNETFDTSLNYSIDRIWPFSDLEKKEKKLNHKTKKFSNDGKRLRIQKVLNQHANEWQKGKLKSMMAMKLKMREKSRHEKWKVKFIEVEIPRTRTRSAPLPYRVNQEVINFRPRSTSNPNMKFKPVKPVILAEDTEAESLLLTKSLNSNYHVLPYGSVLSSLTEKKVQNRACLPSFERGEANNVWSQKRLASHQLLNFADVERFKFNIEENDENFDLNTVLPQFEKSNTLKKLTESNEIIAENETEIFIESNTVIKTDDCSSTTFHESCCSNDFVERIRTSGTVIQTDNQNYGVGSLPTCLTSPWIRRKVKKPISSIDNFRNLPPDNACLKDAPQPVCIKRGASSRFQKHHSSSNSNGLSASLKNRLVNKKRRSLSTQQFSLNQSKTKLSKPCEPIRAPKRYTAEKLAVKLTNRYKERYENLTATEIQEVYSSYYARLKFVEKTMDSYSAYCTLEKDMLSHQQFDSTFFGAVNEVFFPGFVVQGIDSNKLSAVRLEKSIKEEVQHPESFYLAVPKEVKRRDVKVQSKTDRSGKHETDYFQLTSVIIMADIDVAKTVIYFGDVRNVEEEEMSYPCDIVQDMVERVKYMHSDSLLTIQDIYNAIWDTVDTMVRKSVQLKHFMQSQDSSIEKVFDSVFSKVHNKDNKRLLNEVSHHEKNSNTGSHDVTPKVEHVSASQLVKILDCEYSDLRLLTNICSIISPSIRSAIGF